MSALEEAAIDKSVLKEESAKRKNAEDDSRKTAKRLSKLEAEIVVLTAAASNKTEFESKLTEMTQVVSQLEAQFRSSQEDENTPVRAQASRKKVESLPHILTTQSDSNIKKLEHLNDAKNNLQVSL